MLILDESFPMGRFEIEGFNAPFKIDRDINGDGIMLYVREEIPAKLMHR